MKTLTTATAVLVLAAGAAGAQTLDELKNDGRFNDAARTDNVLTYGMGYHQQRYSPLNQINAKTIKRLVPVWSVSLDNNWGGEAPANPLKRRHVLDDRPPHGGDRRGERQAALAPHARLAGRHAAR